MAAMATDPLCPGRRVHRRTISFEYECVYGQLKIRTPDPSTRRAAAARVNICLCSEDLDSGNGPLTLARGFLDWHNIPPRPSPIPGDHTAVFVDMGNHNLRATTTNQLKIHVSYDPKKHSESIYRQRTLPEQLAPGLTRGWFTQISAIGHGCYGIQSHPEATPVVPAGWERMANEDPEAFMDATCEPGRNQDGVVVEDDARSSQQ
ncbi:hypothetical protein B0H63DRAFT_528181 [Podospora didyma]|uniref:Uncharacterized protein n=1 Tax=Podospora didyma TaxID=330526 RepID=A0AAE0K6Y2_9PEZI|nr:hypothetical protein B0H63DRAFT_528181 [Podospora didyma]